MRRYQASLFSTDGQWVTDYQNSNTVEEVEESLANQGSRWFFYPFHVVIVDHNNGWTKDNQRIMSAAWPFEDMKGKTLKTFGKMIANLSDNEKAAILDA